MSSSYGTNSLTTLRATEIFVLMHSGIVNGYQLLCDAHTVPEQHRGIAALFLFWECLYRPPFLGRPPFSNGGLYRPGRGAGSI